MSGATPAPSGARSVTGCAPFQLPGVKTSVFGSTDIWRGCAPSSESRTVTSSVGRTASDTSYVMEFPPSTRRTLGGDSDSSGVSSSRIVMGTGRVVTSRGVPPNPR